MKRDQKHQWETLARAPRWGLWVMLFLMFLFPVGFAVDESDVVPIPVAIGLAVFIGLMTWRAMLGGVFFSEGRFRVVNPYRTYIIDARDIVSIHPPPGVAGRLRLEVRGRSRLVRVMESAQFGENRDELRRKIEERMSAQGMPDS